MNGLHRSLVELYSQISKVEPQPSKPGPLAETALLAAGQCYVLYMILLATVWGISLLFAITLAAAVCTVLLIMATRRATLRQIQTSLLVLSEQFDTLQRSLQGGQPSGGGQATKEPSG